MSVTYRSAEHKFAIPLALAAWIVLTALVPHSRAQDYAKGPVLGRITFTDGKPAAGVRVRAFDHDGTGDLDKNDFIGETTTDAQGDYSIRIEAKHWDPAPHNITTWRPDVFITVLRNVGVWVKVGQSKTYNDKPHRESLRIDLQIPADRWVEKSTAFKTATHGWRFANYKQRVCWPFNNICSDWTVCGGMSLSALRRYAGGPPIPADTKPTDSIGQELVSAQLQTMTEGSWAKFVEFTQSPTKPQALAYHTIGHKTTQEVPKLRRVIDSGMPAILGLIRVEQDNFAGGVFHNHQVLATGYRFNEATGQMSIDVYDPNHPLRASSIALVTRAPENQIHASQTTLYPERPGEQQKVIERVRGFFVVDVAVPAKEKAVRR